MNEAPQPAELHTEHSASQSGLIAPLWHTALLLILLLGGSLANTRSHHGAATPRSHTVLYAVTIGWELLLFAVMYWGLRVRRTPLRQLLGVRRAGTAEWWMDMAIGLGFWFASAIILAAAALLLRFVHLDAETIRRAVMPLAPSSPLELAIWIALSITAGICEEFIFRGYLQQQFTRMTRHASIGIAIAALIFGLAHGYEGGAGMLLIVFYGALFGILAFLRGSLRAGIFAHAWHDSMSGIFLYFGAHVLQRIPH